MSTDVHPAGPTTALVHRNFVRERLGSALALAPLGVWTVVHLWNNLAAFRGADAWQRAVTEHPHPVAQVITFVVVLGPLMMHLLWGVRRLGHTRPNNLRYATFENLKFALQRLSAVGVLAFLGAHLWLAFLSPHLLQGRAEPFHDIAHEMRHHTPTLVVYLLGTLGVVYHLANGVSSAAIAFGVAVSPRAHRRFDRLAIVLLLVLLAMAWGAIYALYRAGA